MEKSNLSQELYYLQEICSKLDSFLQWAQSLVMAQETKNSQQKYIGTTTTTTTKGFMQLTVAILISITSHVALADYL